MDSFHKNISGIQLFYICLYVPVDIPDVSFNFRFSSRNCQKTTKTNEKDNFYKTVFTVFTVFTIFTIEFRSKNLINFMNLNSLDIESNISRKTAKNLSDFTNFWACIFCLVSDKIFALHHFLTPKYRNVEALWKQMSVFCIFLYIFVRKCLFHRRSKISSRRGCVLGSLNNLFKTAHCLSLIKCFIIFHFDLNFWKFNYFLAFQYFHL